MRYELWYDDERWPPSEPSATVSPVSSDDDTAMGEGGQAFPLTSRSAVLGSGSDDPIQKSRAFNRLVKAYWKPVYKHIRVRWKKSNEDAKDLTQGFFVRALEKDTFGGFKPEMARFRTYVRTCLDNYLANASIAERAQKRGGGLVSISLDFGDAEKELESSAAMVELDTEDLFDREWARSLVATATKALSEELEQKGRGVPFQVFRRYDLAADTDERPTYAALAQELGIKPSDVSNYLNASRKRFRELVLDSLRELTASEEEFRMEALELLGDEATRVT
jgi:RNA polymerase sigma factor (sigma-70 family)